MKLSDKINSDIIYLKTIPINISRCVYHIVLGKIYDMHHAAEQAGNTVSMGHYYDSAKAPGLAIRKIRRIIS